MRLILAITFMLSLLSLSGTALAGSDSYYIGARSGADVFASPNKQAEITAHLPRKRPVMILQKRRNWWQIETIGTTNKVTGWVFEGSVRKRYQTTYSKKSSSFLSGFASLFRSPEAPKKTAVLGVRGLDDNSTGKTAKETTEHAKKMVKWMDTLHVENEAVATFIDEGDLNP